MYVRVARFEGINPSEMDAQAGEMKRQLDAAQSGKLPEEAPAEVATLMETVMRFVQFVDRENGTISNSVTPNLGETYNPAWLRA